MKYSGHISPHDFALYVMDALDDAQKDRVESHVLACGACADALAREACFESAFEQLGASAHAGAVVVPMARAVEGSRGERAGRVDVDAGRLRARRAWQHRAAGGVAGALAAAAAIVLALATNSTRVEPAGAVARGASLDADAVPTRSAGVIGEPDYEMALQSTDALDGG